MWPLYQLSHEIIGITITSTYLSCSWIQKITSEYFLKAYSKQLNIQHEVIDFVMYNPSKIKYFLEQFLHSNNIYNAYAIFAVENSHDVVQKHIIMQYQLLALSIPLNCIMVTSCDSIMQNTQDSVYLPFSSSFNNLEKNEILHNIGLHIIGKKLL